MCPNALNTTRPERPLNDPLPAPCSHPRFTDEGTQVPGGNGYAKATVLQSLSWDSNPGSSAPEPAPACSRFCGGNQGPTLTRCLFFS